MVQQGSELSRSFLGIFSRITRELLNLPPTINIVVTAVVTPPCVLFVLTLVNYAGRPAIAPGEEAGLRVPLLRIQRRQVCGSTAEVYIGEQ